MKNWTVVANLILLLIVSCGKKESIPGDHGAISAEQNKSFFEDTGHVKPYRANISYSDKMSECIYADTSEKSCTPENFPLIGLNKDKITVDDILNHTLVSHEFLGRTFEKVLQKVNPEILQMFGAVSAVVISDNINPSFFYSMSGTIYLSGRYFWRNYDEWKQLTKVRDYREGMGNSLQFTFDADYIKNGISLTQRADRNVQTYDEISLSVSRLLFHELTHANDFFPKSFYTSSKFDSSKTYQKIAHDRYVNQQLASDELKRLTSIKLTHFGQILYHGLEAKEADNLVLADEIVSEFKNDVASDFYGYSNAREDYAMLAEEALMLHYYNFSRFVIVIKYPNANFNPPDDYEYPIIWGEKSRVLEPIIKARAIKAVENDLGSEVSQKVSSTLNKYKPVEIPASTSWEDVFKL